MITMMISDEGQISVDFLLGISLFLLSFGFVVQFVPGLFISVSGEGGLNSVAYRTANILADDPGWWENNTHNGTDWEQHTDNVSRIGLAMDITSGTRQTNTPGLLNISKVLQVLNLNNTMLTSKLGLYDKIGGFQIDYGYNITIEQNNSPLVLNGSPAAFGKTPPAFQDVFKLTRIVLAETGKIAVFRFNELTNELLADNKALINISRPQNEDIIIEIIDFNVSNSSSQFIHAKLDGNLLSSSNYTAYKKTNISDFFDFTPPSSLNNTDTLRIVLNYTGFTSNTSNITSRLELDFTGMNFTQTGPPFTEYSSRAEPLYEPAELIIKVWK